MTCAREITQARSPMEAMLVLARHLDALHEKLDAKTIETDVWGDWGTVVATDVPGHAEKVTVTKDNIVVELPAPSAARQAARYQWARDHDVHTLFNVWKDDPEGFAGTFAKGGPLWAYHGDRDAVMQMPLEWRRTLVADIEQDSPATAHEVGRDILKADVTETRESGFSLTGIEDPA